jgi:hypothetical protein
MTGGLIRPSTNAARVEISPMSKILDERPLSEFVRHPEEHARHLCESGEPEILTLDGDAAVVVQSAPAYRALLDLVAGLQATIDLLTDDQDAGEPENDFDGVMEAVAEMERGEGTPAPEAFARLREKLGVRPVVR